jgi:hypothetical protein
MATLAQCSKIFEPVIIAVLINVRSGQHHYAASHRMRFSILSFAPFAFIAGAHNPDQSANQ